MSTSAKQTSNQPTERPVCEEAGEEQEEQLQMYGKPNKPTYNEHTIIGENVLQPFFVDYVYQHLGENSTPCSNDFDKTSHNNRKILPIEKNENELTCV